MAGDVQINCDGKIVGTVNPMPVGSFLKGTAVGTVTTVTWANSAPVTTKKSINITKPTDVCQEYELIVTNPSTVTNLVMNVYNTESLGTATESLLYGPVTLPKWDTSSASSFITLIHGLCNGTDARIKLYNDTALGTADTFGASIRIRELM